ncbi:nicotinamide mononucleotide transporter family protein, partial [Pseudomonadales bacterium]|nr:nicotinamide mononucleotide transporter family protein [Pseudomonadales bacterium]
MINAIWTELSAYSIPEIVAVLASLIYVVLAARNNRYCWPAALLGSSIFVVVLWQYQLLMDSALNVYYAAMAIYGWFMWSRLTTAKSATGTLA